MALSRREFLKRGLALTLASGFLAHPGRRLSSAYAQGSGRREAMYYTKIDTKSVKCGLCPHGCILTDGGRGFCRVRECFKGRLYTLVYELPCAVHVDPIEKKPIFHMLPASTAFSIATAGCNSRCKYCQNWQISQSGPEDTFNINLSCKDTVKKAADAGCKSIAYTYSEPSVFYEYMIDTAKIAHSGGIKNVWVTGGMINPEPLKELAKYIDAANIDFKGFDDSFLRNVCAQNLKAITETIKTSKKHGIWIELTNLVIPTMNDNPSTFKDMVRWILDNSGAETPLHLSRFSPMYKLKNLPPTPVATLETMRDIALAVGLKYVYIGNVPGHKANNTYCPSCGKPIIERHGYTVVKIKIIDSKCAYCGYHIAGIWT